MKKFKFVTRIESEYYIEADTEEEAFKNALKLHEGIVVGHKGEDELQFVEDPSFFVSMPERIVTIDDLDEYRREHAVASDDPGAAFDVVCRLDTVSFKDRKHAEEFCALYSLWVENFQPYVIARNEEKSK